MQKLLCLLSFMLINSGCVTVPDVRGCSVAGTLSAGGICAHNISTATEDLTFDEFLDFLSATPATDTAPEKGAAVCYSQNDDAKMKVVIETMCRMLGNKCSYEKVMEAARDAK